ncbi:MAG TPA: hypothetical protein VGX28_16675 [Frankiaceae bacterium]|nr:hypothetical protein [Frankiaceae bacterium]
MIGTLFGVIAYASSVVIGTVPPHPALPRYCQSRIEATGTESDTEGFRDVAVAAITCADMALDATLDVRVEFVWFHSADGDLPMYEVPGCPTSTVPEVTTPPLPGVLAIARTAVCEQPTDSPAFGRVRIICAHFTVNGDDLTGRSRLDNGLCSEVGAD